MLITRKSMLTGIERTREINCNELQLTEWYSGTPIQNVMPDLSVDDREFIMTGITPEEWDEALSPIEDGEG